MCGRYTNTHNREQLAAFFEMPLPHEHGTLRYNIAPTQQVLAIVAPHDTREWRLLRWGLLPSWANSLNTGYKMINARIETVTSKPAYRNLIPNASHRALQIADGWYEWLKPEKPRQPRQPFFFRLDDEGPFALASLWTTVTIDGQQIDSITMLTCKSAPNKIASKIHDRMPVVRPDSDARRAWLDPDLDAKGALALCETLPTTELTATPANPALNRVGAAPEGPHLLHAPFDASRRD